jgi:hypothetical protein
MTSRSQNRDLDTRISEWNEMQKQEQPQILRLVSRSRETLLRMTTFVESGRECYPILAAKTSPGWGTQCAGWRDWLEDFSELGKSV